MSVEVNAEEIRAAAKRLKQAFWTVQKAARTTIRKEGRPFAKEALRDGLNGFPGHRGGLINYLAASRVGVNPTSNWAGVRVVLGSQKNHQIGRMVRSGYVRHPVFGNRKVWANTAIPNPRAFEDAVNSRADEFKRTLAKALQQALDEAAK